MRVSGQERTHARPANAQAYNTCAHPPIFLGTSAHQAGRTSLSGLPIDNMRPSQHLRHCLGTAQGAQTTFHELCLAFTRMCATLPQY